MLRSNRENGIGYIKENSATGESGWMLSGMIAGGCPVDLVWLEQHYQDTLSSPFTGPVNSDPLSAAWILKIAATDEQLPPAIVGTGVPKPLAVFVADSQGKPVEGASVTFELISGGGDFGKLQCLSVSGNPTGQAGPTCVAPTSHTGFAKAKLTLGKKTGDNPYYIKLNETDKYYTQVGLNIVTAYLQSPSGRISLEQPFEEFGAPDAPKKIIKILGEGNSSLVNSPAGTIKALVADQHDNPISNIALTFTTKPAVSWGPTLELPAPGLFPPILHPGDPVPSGLRNIRFYALEECPVSAPLIAYCTTYDPLTRPTQYFGAQVETILGNTVGTQYTVEASIPASYPTVTTAVFTLYSGGYRDPVDAYIPPTLEIIALQTVNDSGQPVNAAKAGTALKAPLASTLLLYEDDPVLGAPFTCTLGGGQTQCRYITSMGTIKTRKISDGTVIYTPKTVGGTVGPLERLNGRYQAAYTTGPTPAVNLIDAYGTATVTVPEVFGSYFGIARYVKDNGQNTVPTRSVNIQTGQEALLDPGSLAMTPPATTPVSWVSYVVYGVDTTLKIEPAIVLLSDKGNSTTDIAFTYTILPPEYNAVGAIIDLWKSEPNQNNAETWDGWLTGDKTQGAGATGLIRGTFFDISRLYTAQVVLNRGNDAEVRGEKVPIKIMQFKIIKPTKDEKILIKYNSDGDPKMQPLAAQVELKGTNIAPTLIDTQQVQWKFSVEYLVDTNAVSKKRARKGFDPTGAGQGKDGYKIPNPNNPDTPGVEYLQRQGSTFVIDETDNQGAKWGDNFGGGILTITAQTTIDGVEMSDTIIRKVEGEAFSNTFKNHVTAYLEDPDGDQDAPTIRSDVGYSKFFRVIAYIETRYRHFYPAIYGSPKGASYPRENSGGDGGFGVMQLTEDQALPLNNLPEYEQIWNWKENVNGGVEVLRGKLAAAKAYPVFVRTTGCATLPETQTDGAVKYYCYPVQKKAKAATDFSAYQLRIDTYSLYNSGWHYWKWTLVNAKTGKEDWLPRHPQGDAPEGTGSHYADEAEEIEANPPSDF